MDRNPASPQNAFKKSSGDLFGFFYASEFTPRLCPLGKSCFSLSLQWFQHGYTYVAQESWDAAIHPLHGEQMVFSKVIQAPCVTPSTSTSPDWGSKTQLMLSARQLKEPSPSFLR
ncbi:hypothetical protein KIL84_006843 [Mauremys mutica]|uniref:Uncharacterized protein n=1 Tax=Mauremys mutica TaxID=74926 RepID=A0A9D4AWI8_9SAUR|nr:hypothetical protein KIL84_006843 [Mauremys mutica]